MIRLVSLRRRVAFALLVLLLPGCARLDPPQLRPGDDPFDYVYSGRYGSVDPATRSVRRLPASAYKRQWFFLAKRPVPPPMPLADKVHPTLRQWIRTLPGSTRETLFVTFADTVRLPRLPRPDTRLPRDHASNLGRADTTRGVIDTLFSHRSLQYAADSLLLAANAATILDRYWLIQANLVVMPLDRVDSLAASPRVRYIRPNIGEIAPDHDSNSRNDVFEARAKIGSDPYAGLGLGYGWIGLLDTGVRTTHRLLTNPSTLCEVLNCVTGNCAGTIVYTCSAFSSTGSTSDGWDTDGDGHGTATAAILVGNSNHGDAFIGLTEASLDCYTVYNDADDKLRVSATVDAFERAAARLNQVIVAEMQDNTASDIADLAAAADHAYQLGSVVIAANGNAKSWGTGEPARSRRVIGVGAFDLQTDGGPLGAWGPTSDGRVKPDILAPSSTETACNKTDDELDYYNYTSGATPYASGAASLLRNWLAHGTSGIDPGQVYSHLILSGDQVGPFGSTSQSGAGKIALPETGSSWWGKVWVSTSVKQVEIPMDGKIKANVRVDAAIWWPEVATDAAGNPINAHNEIDLEIRGPGGVRGSSASSGGVFERASAEGSGNGRWKLRITPNTMQMTPQVVYWGVSMVPTP